METTQYIVFSFYYINSEDEIDKILKYKYVLRKNNLLTHQELYNEVVRHKHMYNQPVTLHEILIYRNTNECIEMESIESNDLFQNVNCMKDLELCHDHPLHELDRIYVFFKTKTSSSASSSHMRKKSIRNNSSRSSNNYTRRAFI